MTGLSAYYQTILAGTVIVWTVSAAVGVGYSLWNEIVAVRQLRAVSRIRSPKGRGDRMTAEVADWLRKKHLWLLMATVIEIGLWITAFAPRGATIGLLTALGLVAINILISLIAVGSTDSRRRLLKMMGEEMEGGEEDGK